MFSRVFCGSMSRKVAYYKNQFKNHFFAQWVVNGIMAITDFLGYPLAAKVLCGAERFLALSLKKGESRGAYFSVGAVLCTLHKYIDFFWQD